MEIKGALEPYYKYGESANPQVYARDVQAVSIGTHNSKLRV
jgi:hypothetical protein